MPAGKDQDFSLSPEIARLSALLARDPNSKLFMPLAEEYIKAGMAEEAVMTLEDGLKANPFYMSAKVLLGKAYMEKNDLEDARVQFEQVVKVVPDNLLAHRKLGEIYRVQGNRENAVRSYRMITLLNPKDEDAKRLLAELESGALIASPPAPEPAQAEPETEPVVEIVEAVPEEDEAAVPEVIASEFSVEADVYAIDEDAAASDEGQDWLKEQRPEEAAEISAPKKSGYALDLSQAAGLEDIFGTSASASGKDEPQSHEGVYEINDLSAGGMSAGVPEAAPPVHEEPTEDAAVFDAEFAPVEDAKEGREPFETETLAELYIAQGFYGRAITIYKNMLLLEPRNLVLKQKLEELYQLEKLNAEKSAKAVEPEVPEAQPEPVPADFSEQDDGAGIVWEAEAEPLPEPAANLVTPRANTVLAFDPAAVSRLELLLENIRRKGRR